MFVASITAGCAAESDYDDYMDRFTPYVTKQVEFTARIPIDNQTVKVPLNLHGHDVPYNPMIEPRAESV